MKQLIFKLFILAILILTSGCKPNQIVTENIISVIDSSAVWELKDSLFEKEMRFFLLKNDLERTKNENYNLWSEVLIHEINYDTVAQINANINNPLVFSEKFTLINSGFEKTINEYEILLHEASIENISLITKYKNLQFTVETLKNENITLKEKSNKGFQSKCFFAVLIILIIFLFLMKL